MVNIFDTIRTRIDKRTTTKLPIFFRELNQPLLLI